MHANAGKFFTEVPLLNQNTTFSMQICKRKEFMPLFRIRKARVEDCDDLIPLFKKRHLLDGKDQDNYIARLVQPSSGDTLAFVAEVYRFNLVWW